MAGEFIGTLSDFGAAPPAASAGKTDYRELVTRVASEEGVNPDLMLRVVGKESAFNPKAVSPKGAIGLGQVMPATFREVMGPDADIHDPETNVRAGARYLKRQLTDFGDERLALAAYNAGPGAVRKAGGVPNFAETKDYVATIAGGGPNPGLTRRTRSQGGTVATGFSLAELEGRAEPKVDTPKAAETEPTVLGEAGKGLARGLTELAGAVGTGIQFAGARLGAESVEEFGKGVAKYWDDHGEQFAPHKSLEGAILDNPALLTKGAWWAYNVMNMVPSLAASIVPGVGAARAITVGGRALALTEAVVQRLAWLGGSIVGGGAGGALEGAQTYQEVLKRGGSEPEAAAAGTQMALASAALNALSVGNVTAAAKSRMLKFITSGVTEGTTEWLEEPAEGAILSRTSVAKPEDNPLERARTGFNVFPVAALTGGVAGALTRRAPADPTVTERFGSMTVTAPQSAVDRIREQRADRDAVPVSELGGETPAAPAARTAQDPRAIDQPAQRALEATPADEPAETRIVAAGKPTSFSTESGTELDGRFAVVDAGELITSHDRTMRENPRFPQELQPRDRSAAAYEIQVAKIAGQLNPARLGQSPTVAEGAPIVGADGIVESGNGRVLALDRAYGKGTADGYREWLTQNAMDFGIAPEAVSSMERPVLVRVRETPVNRAEFARQANAPTTAVMSPLDTARADAARMGSIEGLAITDDGNFMVPANDGIIKGFFRGLPLNEQAGLVDRDGRIGQAGYRRFMNAILVKAYGAQSPAVVRIVDSLDASMRNVSAALVRVAPVVARARENMRAGAIADRDITEDIIRAVDELGRLKAEGMSVADLLAQSQMFPNLNTETLALLQFLEANLRSPSKIAAFVEAYLSELESYGAPAQDDMFGGAEAPNKQAIMEKALAGLGTTEERAQPESDATLREQQKALVEGRREVVMFPTGTKELALPKGMERVETPRGVFHFDPEKIDSATIEDLSAQGRENDLLNLGPLSKQDVAASGEEPIAVVERTPDGTEVAAALTTPSAAEATAADVKSAAAPGNTITIEDPNAVVKERQDEADAAVSGGEGERGTDAGKPAGKARPKGAGAVSEPAEAGDQRPDQTGRAGDREPAAGDDERSETARLKAEAKKLKARKTGVSSSDAKKTQQRGAAGIQAGAGAQESSRGSDAGSGDGNADTAGAAPNIGARIPGSEAPAAAKDSPAVTAPPSYGDTNKVFTKERADAARAKLKAKLGHVRAGIDPEIMLAGLELAGYHVEAGARSFGAFTKAMITDLGEAARAYLKSWYLGVRNYPGFDNTGMDTAATVEGADADKILDRSRRLEELAASIDEFDPRTAALWRQLAADPPADVSRYGIKFDIAALERMAAGIIRDAKKATKDAEPITDEPVVTREMLLDGWPDLRDVPDDILDKLVDRAENARRELNAAGFNFFGPETPNTGHLKMQDVHKAAISPIWSASLWASRKKMFEAGNKQVTKQRVEIFYNMLVRELGGVEAAPTFSDVIDRAQEARLRVSKQAEEAIISGFPGADDIKANLSALDFFLPNPVKKAAPADRRKVIEREHRTAKRHLADAVKLYREWRTLGLEKATDYEIAQTYRGDAESALYTNLALGQSKIETLRSRIAALERAMDDGGLFALKEEAKKVAAKKAPPEPPYTQHPDTAELERVLKDKRVRAELKSMDVHPESSAGYGFAMGWLAGERGVTSDQIDDAYMERINQAQRGAFVDGHTAYEAIVEHGQPAGQSIEEMEAAATPTDTEKLKQEAKRLANTLNMPTTEVMVFASGLSRAKDFTAALETDTHAGVDIGELSEPALAQLGQAVARSNASVFVDSGAFSMFRANLRAKGNQFTFEEFGEGGKALDFDDILARYEKLALEASKADEANGGAAAYRLHFVMPDIVGDQSGSIDLLRRHKDTVEGYAGRGGIFPIQAGERSLLEVYDEIAEILGTGDFIVGIPSNAEAAPNDQVEELLRERGADIEGVHFLGAGSRKTLTPRIAAVRAAGFDGHVSGDANLLRSKLYGSSDRAVALRTALGTNPVDEAAHEAATSPTNDRPEPTEPQQEAGNYRKGHVRVAGLDISIENPEGSTRSGTDRAGKPWSVTMSAHYGYIRGTVGVDKEHIDAYIAPGTPEDYDGPVFVVDQYNPGGRKIDEHKVIIGADDFQDAAKIYDAHFSDGSGEQRRRYLNGATMAAFKDWLENGDHSTDFADYMASRAPKAPDFVSTFPFPTSEQYAAEFFSETLAGEEQESLKFVHDEQANEMLGYLRAVDAAKEALQTGIDPKTGKRPKSPAAAKRLKEGLEAIVKQAPDDYADSLGAYASEFGLVAADAFDKAVRARYAAERTDNPPEPPPQGDLLAQVDAADAGAPSDVEAAAAAPAGLPEARAPADKPAAIEDFGAKIEGARKDAMQAYRDALKDAQAVDIATQPLSKSWPEPDYTKLLEAGADSWAVAFAHAARDAVPPKPSKPWKLKGWVEGVKVLRRLTEETMSGERLTPERVKQRLDESERLSEVSDRAQLYAIVGHEKSLKGVRISRGSYSVYEGVNYSPSKTIWSVERQAKATAFSNWPTTLAKGDTREEAIEKFKAMWSAETPAQTQKKTHFEIYGRRREGTFFIGKKIGANVVELKGGFETSKAARQWKAENQAELERLLAQFKDVPSERRATNDPRVGVDHRNGADVTPEQFTETFGFRGGQFGNTMPQAERQTHLNETYDALMDLAGVIGVSPRALSLNGELGLAFGARGTGGVNAAAAHYEPDAAGAVTDDRVVINLTRKRGAGSLAHEWFHAVDNYFARMGSAKGSYQTERVGAVDGVRAEMQDAFRRVRLTIADSALAMRSKKLDQTRTKAYWSTGREMAARAFESYIVAKLQDQSAANDYLANIVSEEYWNAAAALGIEKEGTYPYPTAAEVPAIRAAFDHFFETVQTRETDRGTAMFSRAGQRVADATPQRAAKTLEEARSAAREFVGRPITNGETGVVAQVSNTTLSKMTSQSATAKSTTVADHVLAVANIDQLFAAGLLNDSKRDQKGEPTIRAIHRFVAPMVTPDGRVLAVRMLVKETVSDKQPNPLYTVEAIDVEKPALDAPQSGIERDAVAGSSPQAGFKDSVVAALESVKEATRGVFSRRGARGGGIALPDLKAIVDNVTRAWKNAPRINVLRAPSHAPADLWRQIRASRAEGIVQGAYHDGEIYLFAENIVDPAEAETVLLHEATHYGLEGALGSDLNAALMQVWRDNLSVQVKAAKLREKYRDLTHAGATFEVLADLGAAAPKLKGWAAFVDAVKRFARAIGLTRVDPGEAMVQDLLRAARRFYEGKPQRGAKLFGNSAFHRAFHGSPHDFDAFSMDKIGTGEGNQAYGWGLYFAGKKEVAEFYKSQLARDPRDDVSRIVERLQKESNATSDDVFFEMQRYPALHDFLNDSAFKNHVLTAIRGAKEGGSADAMAAYRALDKMLPKAAGRLYEVELAPKEDEYLDWDKPMTEQSERVRSALEAMDVDLFRRWQQNGAWPHITGQVAYKQLAGGMTRGATEAGKHEAASRALHQAGIPGIRYLDGSSRSKPLRVLKREFLAELPEDADFEEVTELLGTGTFSPANEAIIKALADDDWLGFDYPAQALSAALSGQLSNWDPSSALTKAVSDAQAGGTHNYVIFDDTHVSVQAKFSRAGQRDTGAEIQDSQQRAEAALARTRGGFRPLDSTLRAISNASGFTKLTSKGYDLLLKLGAFVPEKAKAGIVADYGMPEAVIDRRDTMFGTIRQRLRQGKHQIERLMGLTRAESRIAYEWMNGRDAEGLIEQLPEDSRQALTELRDWITEMGAEAVRLGQLTADAYDRNKFAYLHRSYLKHEVDEGPQAKANRARAIRVLGDQYKGRGLADPVTMSRIQNAVGIEFWQRMVKPGEADKGLKGEQFVRLERRARRGEAVGILPGVEEANQRGRLLEVAYWPAQLAVPRKYAAWERDPNLWTAQGTKGDKVIMWRDFTASERQAMGEIDEVRFAAAKTLQLMIHDVETGRYLEWLANTQARPDAPRDARVVPASERMADTFAPDTWVQVPDGKIPGTQAYRYGKLQGLFLPGPIWNDVRQVVNHRYQPLGETYATLLKAWKISKTALSPAVHMNNVMANLVMADWHDVGAPHMLAALNVIVNGEDPVNARIRERFEDAGGAVGTFALSELQREQLKPLLDALRKDVEQPVSGMLNAGAVVQALMAGRIRDAIAAGQGSKVAGGVTAAGAAMIDLYQTEDVVFRLAAFIKAKGEGATDLAAGKLARKSFLDYNINAPWIQAMRSTAFPFISFTYRAIPMLLDVAGHKPWKLMKMAVVLGVANALGYAVSGGDEDKERKLLPDEKRGRLLGAIAPKLLRMPWNDEHGSPVFLDIRRFIPLGDVFDLGQTHSAIPTLPFALPGGPLAVLAELALNRSQFTGKPITKETDTALEKTAKITDHLYKAAAPNLVGLPGTYATTGVVNAGGGRTDTFGREQSVPHALLSSIGVKLAAYPQDQAALNARKQYEAQLREINENIGALRREYARNGISKEEFQRKLMHQVDKKLELAGKFKERVTP